MADDDDDNDDDGSASATMHPVRVVQAPQPSTTEKTTQTRPKRLTKAPQPFNPVPKKRSSLRQASTPKTSNVQFVVDARRQQPQTMQETVISPAPPPPSTNNARDDLLMNAESSDDDNDEDDASRMVHAYRRVARAPPSPYTTEENAQTTPSQAAVHPIDDANADENWNEAPADTAMKWTPRRTAYLAPPQQPAARGLGGGSATTAYPPQNRKQKEKYYEN
jgi:hypothetical protein